jgi:hypothetical protein
MSASERAYACRLTPDRALLTIEEAAEWVEERGLVTLMPCCSLPSLFAACHEEPYAPGKGGFAQWPRTKWWWGGALAGRPGIVWLRIHRGKGLLAAERIARLADSLCRAALTEAEEGPHARLVAHLAEAGPSFVGELKEELDLDTRALKRARDALERVGAVVSRGVVVEPHRHTTELRRWDQAFPDPSAGGIDDLVLAGVAAAVVAPERELPSWFSWPLGDAVDRLVAEGRLARADGLISLASGS